MGPTTSPWWVEVTVKKNDYWYTTFFGATLVLVVWKSPLKKWLLIRLALQQIDVQLRVEVTVKKNRWPSGCTADAIQLPVAIESEGTTRLCVWRRQILQKWLLLAAGRSQQFRPKLIHWINFQRPSCSASFANGNQRFPISRKKMILQVMRLIGTHYWYFYGYNFWHC